MRKFETLVSIAAPYNESDVDTDAIFPARFLLLLNRAGLGKHLFNDLRTPPNAKDPFVLDRPDFKQAQILVVGERFGIGSSREHAVWAMSDVGIRCVIARSFGDIFRANCFKNGVLPIALDTAQHMRVLAAANRGKPLTVDLETKLIKLSAGSDIAFDVPDQQRRALMLGQDEIGAILDEDADTIAAFEAQQKQIMPWLSVSPEPLSSFYPTHPSKDAEP
ncbi:MAG: 3-isopropylmalate dehydratase small subunit [Pseudomonadota bacterium]